MLRRCAARRCLLCGDGDARDAISRIHKHTESVCMDMDVCIMSSRTNITHTCSQCSFIGAAVAERYQQKNVSIFAKYVRFFVYACVLVMRLKRHRMRVAWTNATRNITVHRALFVCHYPSDSLRTTTHVFLGWRRETRVCFVCVCVRKVYV